MNEQDKTFAYEYADGTVTQLTGVHAELASAVDSFQMASKESKDEAIHQIEASRITPEERDEAVSLLAEMRENGMSEQDVDHFSTDFCATEFIYDSEAAPATREEMMDNWRDLNEQLKNSPESERSSLINDAKEYDKSLLQSGIENNQINFQEFKDATIQGMQTNVKGFFQGIGDYFKEGWEKFKQGWEEIKEAYAEGGLIGVIGMALAKKLMEVKDWLEEQINKDKVFLKDAKEEDFILNDKEEEILPEEEQPEAEADSATKGKNSKLEHDEDSQSLDGKGNDEVNLPEEQSMDELDFEALGVDENNVDIYQAIMDGNGTEQEKVQAMQNMKEVEITDDEMKHASAAIVQMKENGIDDKSIGEMSASFISTATFNDGKTAHDTRATMLEGWDKMNKDLNGKDPAQKAEIVDKAKSQTRDILGNGEKQDLVAGKDKGQLLSKITGDTQEKEIGEVANKTKNALSRIGESIKQALIATLVPGALPVMIFMAMMKNLMKQLSKDMEGEYDIEGKDAKAAMARLEAQGVGHQDIEINSDGIGTISMDTQTRAVNGQAYEQVVYSIDGGESMTQDQLMSELQGRQAQDQLEKLADYANENSKEISYSIDLGYGATTEFLADADGKLFLDGQEKSAEQIVNDVQEMAKENAMEHSYSSSHRAAEKAGNKAADNALTEMTGKAAGVPGIEQSTLLETVAEKFDAKASELTAEKAAEMQKTTKTVLNTAER